MTINNKAQEYLDFKSAQHKEIAEFTDKYCGWAFNDDQRKGLLKKFNFSSWSELEENCIGFCNGVMLMGKVQDFQNLCSKQIKDLHDKMMSDHEFAQKAFEIEMANFECCYSERYSEVLVNLNFTKFQQDLREKGLEKVYAAAKAAYIEDMTERGYI